MNDGLICCCTCTSDGPECDTNCDSRCCTHDDWRCDAHGITTTGDCPKCGDEMIALAEEDL